MMLRRCFRHRSRNERVRAKTLPLNGAFSSQPQDPEFPEMISLFVRNAHEFFMKNIRDRLFVILPNDSDRYNAFPDRHQIWYSLFRFHPHTVMLFLHEDTTIFP